MAIGWAKRSKSLDSEPVHPTVFARRINAIVGALTKARKVLKDEIAPLRIHVNAGDLVRIGRVANECLAAFDEARWILKSTPAPIGAEPCTDSLMAWLEMHVDACDALCRASGTRNSRHIETAQDLLRQANTHAHTFNRHRRLVVERVAA